MAPAPQRARPSRALQPRAVQPRAEVDPVAVVRVASPLPQLDRAFEYSVPAGCETSAVPGVRVKVVLAGRTVDGFVVQRRSEPEHSGALTPLSRVVSPEPVLTPDLLSVVRAVAARYGGTTGDVLRLAIPPRHARAEKALPVAPGADGAASDTSGGTVDEPARSTAWGGYPAGASFLRRLAVGQRPWAAWSARPAAPPGQGWPEALAEAAAATLDAGRGVLIVVPDHRDLDRLEVALVDLLGRGQHVRLTADQGPQARYTAWLRALRGHVRCVIGTRSAAFAPVAALGLVAWWDDGDDLHAEPRAPYPHVREVLRVQAAQRGAALLVGGYARTVTVQHWVERGVVREIGSEDAGRRRAAAAVIVAGEGADQERDGPAAHAHIPATAVRVAREALQHGPVLVQVPRAGYQPALACQSCRAPLRCAGCHGPVAVSVAGGVPACRWCGMPGTAPCRHCGDTRVRTTRVGASRTVEELGRAFPRVPVLSSGSGHVLATVGPGAALVVATPGVEPVAAQGYAASLLLDGWASLERPVLTAAEESLRRWMAAAALTRGRDQGGRVVLCGVPPHSRLPAVEALVRWAPEWFAARELSERRELSLPPTTWQAHLIGPRGALVAAVNGLSLPTGVERFGPLPVPATSPAACAPTGEPGPVLHQIILRAPRGAAAAATGALFAMRAERSLRRESDQIIVRIGSTDALS